MTRLINTCGTGNTIRQSNAVVSSKSLQHDVNKQIVKATDGQFDYTSGQPEYQGNSLCDPARDGSDKLVCCK